MTAAREPAPAKLNLALHVRGRRPDGRHDIETIFAFCTDGDRLSGELADELSLTMSGPFGAEIGPVEDNLVMRAAVALRERAEVGEGAAITLVKNLPVASGIGGGSADAAAALRLLTALWRIDPAYASAVAPELGSDVPACLLSMSARGTGPGDRIELFDDPDIPGTPVLLVNPGERLSTRAVFDAWDGVDRGSLGDWRDGRNDLQAPATVMVPEIGDMLEWLGGQPGAWLSRMSGSGATCFALFESDAERDQAAEAVPAGWWRLATFLR